MRTAAVALAFFLIAACTSVGAQDLGSRDQWQPQTERDPRLGQRVEIEILGQAAVPALKLLSERTGVSLSVAPEDLNTLGERRVTVIAKGLSLKAIMEHLPEALQECHWDVDRSGREPVYLLHRDSGVDYWQMLLERQSQVAAERARALGKRIGEARTALGMSGEAIAELEKTDPLMARAARDAFTRKLMAGVLALPQAELDALLTSGRTQIQYADAPEAVREAARLLMEQQMKDAARVEEPRQREAAKQSLNEIKAELDSTGDVRIEWQSLAPDGERVAMCVQHMCELAIPGRSLAGGLYYLCFHLFLNTGAKDLGEARKIIARMATTAEQNLKSQAEAQWIEPDSPELRRVLSPSLPDAGLDFDEFLRRMSDATGMSIVSDYFKSAPAYAIHPPLAGEPVWRLLYRTGGIPVGAPRPRWPSSGESYRFRLAGKAIVAYHPEWYALVLWDTGKLLPP